MYPLEWTFIAIGAFGVAVLFFSVVSGELGAHIDASTDVHTEVDFDHGFDGPSWHSFTVLATGLAGLGLGGFTAFHYDLPALMCWFIAIATGILFWAIMLFGVVKPLKRSQHNEVFSQDSLVNSEALVILPIPSNGIGEIELRSPLGGYLRLSARSAEPDGTSIPVRTSVLIVSIVDGVALVMQDPNYKELEV